MLGSCCHCQVTGAIFTVFVDACLEKKEAGAYSLSSGSNLGEGVEKMKLVYGGRLLRMCGNSFKRVDRYL